MFLYGAHHSPASSILFRRRSASSTSRRHVMMDGAQHPGILWSTPDLSFYGHYRHFEVPLLWIILSTAASIGLCIQQCVSCRDNPGGAKTWYEGNISRRFRILPPQLVVPLTTVVRLPTAVSTNSTFRIEQSSSRKRVRSTDARHTTFVKVRVRAGSASYLLYSSTNLARSDEQSLSKINVSICACLNFGKILRVTTRRLHLHT